MPAVNSVTLAEIEVEMIAGIGDQAAHVAADAADLAVGGLGQRLDRGLQLLDQRHDAGVEQRANPAREAGHQREHVAGAGARDIAADRDHRVRDLPPEMSMVFAARKLEARMPALESAGKRQPSLHADHDPEAVLAVLVDRHDLVHGADREALIAHDGAVFEIGHVVEQHAILIARAGAPGDQGQGDDQCHDHRRHEDADRHIADGIIPH